MKTLLTMLLLVFATVVFSQETIQIGTQTWMKQNINIGVQIPITQLSTNNNLVEKYCYNNQASNCDIYGGLYQWDEMMNYVTAAGSQGICPEGFRVPTRADWQVMDAYIGDSAKKLQEAGFAHWFKPYTWAGYTQSQSAQLNGKYNGWDSFGFSALPGGYGSGNGNFYSIGKQASFWTSTQYVGEVWGFYRIITYSGMPLFEYLAYQNTQGNSYAGYASLRCIKN